MEPESIYDEVIVRYLLNEANEEEERFVLEWMNADEKNRLYVEALKSTLHLIALKQESEEIDIDQEWNHFRNKLVENQHKQFQFGAYGTYDHPAGPEEKQSRKAKIYKLFIATAVAASLIFAIALGLGAFNNRAEHNDSVSQQAQTPENRAKIDPLLAVVQHEVNVSGQTKRLVLPDGSEVALFNNSAFTYKEPVNSRSREIYLTGKADFKVAKDKTKPFTVFSGDISTTAIGTEFTVTAIEKENQILVRLNEGKVVVKSVNGYNNKWVKDFYLLPGQELVYNKNLKRATVRSVIEKKVADSKINNQVRESPSIPHYNKGSWFMFNNQPLSEVFDALAGMYHVPVVYSKKDVKNMNFIGTFDRSDSLETILKQIAILNNLTVTKENDTYRIKKQPLNKK
ncbi:MAG: FecR family protein [Flavisolibacter sp.]|nr:FecR family protein [Flavisolibacter sp.]